MDSMLSDVSGVSTTVFTTDDGDPGNEQHAGRGVAWHRRIPSSVWLWLIVVGAIGGLWAIAGSFRKVLS